MKEKPLFFAFLFFTLILFIASLSVGKVSISFNEIYHVFFGTSDEMINNLVLNFRLPKSITALLVGISLPISGFLMQELFKNPLADPSVLGITSMASLGVGVVIFLFSIIGLDQYLNNPWITIIASFLGAITALLIVIVFSFRVKSAASLVILGFMISGLSGALIGMMQYFAPSDKIKAFLIWGFGSLSGLSWQQISIFALFVLSGIIVSLFSLRGITALLLGERYAQSLGINIKKLRFIILIATALLTASATAFAGPIGFIGLAIPHICRTLLKTGDMRVLYRWIFVSGIFFMLLFSILTEIFPFGTLPINIITALFGAPIVISILLNNKNEVR
ncbi:iron complex transport system permease protein [Algoriella xinjiangensis]|uniref:Iron complex transport system permease protein n=2 Tax=Algoriella TaxID=1762932 RepID=A0A1I4YZT1_9FLAO|nr:iron ABC transporter permease [Algoriella xinjiangensis]SFN43199.1 iron complex transport system permease protein [Algoriella xinjiangensis]VDH16636.1 Probable ABC transporter permease protein HI_1471 [Algoriella xinjiangensis]